MTAACDFSRVISSLASRSSCCTRLCACLSSGALSRLSITGNGLEARRFWSVLPPPSRFACARASAFSGLVADFAFTSTTSSTLWGASNPRGSGTLKPSPTMAKAWKAIEATSATCMEATRPNRSSR